MPRSFCGFQRAMLLGGRSLRRCSARTVAPRRRVARKYPVVVLLYSLLSFQSQRSAATRSSKEPVRGMPRSCRYQSFRSNRPLDIDGQVRKMNTSSHLRANNSLRRSPVVTSSMTIKRKHESNCSRRPWISLGSSTSGYSYASCFDERIIGSALFEPLVAYCMVEQHAE